jgi:hypothetical protein
LNIMLVKKLKTVARAAMLAGVVGLLGAAFARGAPLPKEADPAWKAEFRKVYGLKAGELVRRVAPPYPECRAEFFNDRIRAAYTRSKVEPPPDALKKDHTDHFTAFVWKDGWVSDRLSSHTVPVPPDKGVTLGRLIAMVSRYSRARLDAADETLETRVTGDWSVRADADPSKLAAALEKILQAECGLTVAVAVKEAERDVYVLSGKYTAKPLPERKENAVEVYARELTDRTTGGGGRGTLEELAASVEGWVEAPVILEKVEGAPKAVEWHFNFRSPFTAAEHAEDTDPEAVMKNIAAQTGLTAKREKRAIQVWTVAKK